MNAPASNALLAAIAQPLPAFITADQMAASLTMYRYKPEHIAALLAAIADAMHNEHYRQDGELSDFLHGASAIISDTQSNLSAAIEEEKEHAPCYCGKCDSCVAARSDEHHDRRRDGVMA